MKPITAEWVDKAEGDFATVEQKARARKNPNYDGVCFHAQQCAEKYLKTLAVELDLPFLRTHDLVILLEQLLPVYPLWEVYRGDLAYLSEFAVSFRYPGESADRESALDARRRCRISAALPLPRWACRHRGKDDLIRFTQTEVRPASATPLWQPAAALPVHPQPVPGSALLELSRLPEADQVAQVRAPGAYRSL